MTDEQRTERLTVVLRNARLLNTMRFDRELFSQLEPAPGHPEDRFGRDV